MKASLSVTLLLRDIFLTVAEILNGIEGCLAILACIEEM